jgi:hypothetical protein
MKKFAFVLPLFLLSCGMDDPKDLLPDATGTHGEILVIMDDGLWNGPIGEALVSQMSKNCPGPLLRPEPLFGYSRVTPDGVSHLNKLNRLMLKLFIDKDSSYSTTMVVEERDYYAKGQMFLVVKDSDINRLYEFVLNDFDVIAKILNDFELESYRNQYRKSPNKRLSELSEEKFGISISLPEDAILYTEQDSFIWAKRDRSHNLMGQEPGSGMQVYWIQQGILFWAEPYTDISQLDMDTVLRHRDTILKYNVPGKFAGSYMATEYDPYYKPQGTAFEFEGNRALEIRGLWKHEGVRGAVGGGPFVQHTILNKKRNMLITVCGYVHGPKFDKREYVREVKAMLSTIEMAE